MKQIQPQTDEIFSIPSTSIFARAKYPSIWFYHIIFGCRAKEYNILENLVKGQAQKLGLTSGEDFGAATATIRGSELLAAALLLGFAFSYIVSLPDLSTYTDINLFGSFTNDVQQFINFCMFMCSILCCFVLVADVHILMLLSDLPPGLIADSLTKAGFIGLSTMLVYWTAVLFFGLGVSFLAASMFHAWLGIFCICAGVVFLGIGLPTYMTYTNVCRILILSEKNEKLLQTATHTANLRAKLEAVRQGFADMYLYRFISTEIDVEDLSLLSIDILTAQMKIPIGHAVKMVDKWKSTTSPPHQD